MHSSGVLLWNSMYFHLIDWFSEAKITSSLLFLLLCSLFLFFSLYIISKSHSGWTSSVRHNQPTETTQLLLRSTVSAFLFLSTSAGSCPSSWAKTVRSREIWDPAGPNGPNAVLLELKAPLCSTDKPNGDAQDACWPFYFGWIVSLNRRNRMAKMFFHLLTQQERKKKKKNDERFC